MGQRGSWPTDLTVQFFGQVRAGIAIEALRRAAYPQRIARARPAASLFSHFWVTL